MGVPRHSGAPGRGVRRQTPRHALVARHSYGHATLFGFARLEQALHAQLAEVAEGGIRMLTQLYPTFR
jgi:hypothetical protein